MLNLIPFRDVITNSEIIRLAVMLYVRLPLALMDGQRCGRPTGL
ncbi:MAG: hypothetical protein AAF882_22040 [Pseudomonadota bacterium]